MDINHSGFMDMKIDKSKIYLCNYFPCNKLSFEMTKGENECVLVDIYQGGVCLYVGIDMSV